ncbi:MULTISPECIES: efflux RND transporter periplasmic adaptor subunit [Betaproteobacteria]|jgi:cobalt-zinc-cadmium efflux system membrane fusion protein|uniref:efflux RND transporter periplasmic adaptor subunit n=1 Tax=Betaproteobacteria TaxID=28216 RepID=UPI00260E3A5F|nr:efflux RND transporter periplasmic adaptor subunit [Zoogloea sp.]MDD2991319.1 efflux RND transporter periplasmic adaptor subunit [Zoogloea sp.]
MKNPFNSTPSRLNPKQAVAIAAIVISGIAAGAWILGTGPATPVSETAEPAAHAEAEGHDDKEHHGSRAGDGHADTGGHGDAEHHVGKTETEGEAHDETIVLTDAQIQSAGIGIDKATPARIRTSSQLPGEIRFNEDRTAHVVPRLTGVVESVPANLGQPVKRGQVLAVIASTGLSELRSELLAAQRRLALARSTYTREKQLWQEKISAEQDYLAAQQTLREAEIAVANAQQKLVALGASATGTGSLNRYEIRAPFDGIVVEKHIALGEAVKEDASIFTLSDLSSVWAEIVVPAKDLNVVRVGEKVVVRATAFDSTAEGQISYVGALLGQDTRTAKARVTLPNPKMAWRPGLFVNVDVVSGETEVPVSVLADAVQTVEDKPVVFVRVKDGFTAQPVKLGRADGKRVEVIDGLAAGTAYAASGSFVLKAELGKGSAEHSH